LNMW